MKTFIISFEFGGMPTLSEEIGSGMAHVLTVGKDDFSKYINEFPVTIKIPFKNIFIEIKTKEDFEQMLTPLTDYNFLKNANFS